MADLFFVELDRLMHGCRDQERALVAARILNEVPPTRENFKIFFDILNHDVKAALLDQFDKDY